MLRRKTLVTRNGDSPFWGPVMSSGYSEKYKHVFGSKNPGVNVTCVRMFSQLCCRGGLLFGCGPCWWVNISSRLICVTDSGPMISALRPVWHPWTRALFSAVKHSPSAGSRCFLYRICLPLVVVPTLVLFLIHAFLAPTGSVRPCCNTEPCLSCRWQLHHCWMLLSGALCFLKFCWHPAVLPRSVLYSGMAIF